MARRDSGEQMDKSGKNAPKNSGSTNSGNPNPVNPNKARSTEHKSGYGGDGGEPRTSSDTEKGED
jgi:hypothetical protein